MSHPAVEMQRIFLPQGDVIAILRVNNRLGDNDLITAFNAAIMDVAEVDGLILDLRNTPSGGNSEVDPSIMRHFTETVQPFQIHTIPSLNREFGVPRRFVEQVSPRYPYFDPSRIIVIGLDVIGVHSIASYMDDLLGATSQSSFADSTISLSIPTGALLHVDGTPREDFVADQFLSSADRGENGGDAALEAALGYLCNQ